jgi:hypothetical protein
LPAICLLDKNVSNMKKIFTLTAVAVLLTVVISSCVKQAPFNEGYWLSKERGVVAYSSPTCPYYIVETYNGYTVVRSYGGYRPYENDVMYGDFSHYGSRDFYNRTEGRIYSGEVMDYWLTEYGANDALDYYCY